MASSFTISYFFNDSVFDKVLNTAEGNVHHGRLKICFQTINKNTKKDVKIYINNRLTN